MTITEAQQTVDQWIKTTGVRYFNELTNTAILMEEVGEVALGMEFYNRDSWELISHSGDTIVLSLANEGRGGRDIIEFVKGRIIIRVNIRIFYLSHV